MNLVQWAKKSSTPPPQLLIYLLGSIWGVKRNWIDSWLESASNIVCSDLKVTKVNSKIVLIKSSKNYFIFLPAFYLVMCLMKDPKNFWRIVILKTRELVSFWGVKTHFGKLHMNWCNFRHNKIWLQSILCCNFKPIKIMKH